MDVAENHKSRWYPHLRFPAVQGRLVLTFEQRQQKLFLKPELRHREKEKKRESRERERKKRTTSRLKPQEIYAMWTVILNLVNPLIFSFLYFFVTLCGPNFIEISAMLEDANITNLPVVAAP